MKAPLAALIGFASLAWASEGPDSYGLRAMGRAEAHSTGSLSGVVPDRFFSQAIPTMSEWNRTLGRSEAHYNDGLIRTSEGVFVRDRAPEGFRDGCTIIDERRAEGRAEAKDLDSEEVGPDSDIRPKC